ncbi:MAG TPA: glycerol-3-phosphate 1-O-acyltransferase PlsY [Bacteroidales bacterium]|nr:glycerol-3-phosphate 1-O-acyltransferase PlsY [Bacteroidales bacterium]
MNIPFVIVSVLAGYLLGSISTAVWAGKLFHGIDVREHGSGNAGATNVIRVLGWWTGIPVMLIDVCKGFLAAFLPVILHLADAGSNTMIIIQIICGAAAILGHLFPVYTGFRGGKGVATTVGTLLALHPLLTLSCLGVFLVVFILFGIVSVSSMSFGVAFPVFLFTVFHTDSIVFKVFSVLIAIALIVTHRENIGRLLRGEEKKLIRGKGK